MTTQYTRRRIGRATACLLAVGMTVFTGCSAPDKITPPSTAQRIVTFGPHLTETVFALGEASRIVGRTRYCDFPPEALALPVVGDYLSPDFEKLTLLKPDLLVLPGEHDKLAQFARLKGITTLHVDMDSLATIDSGIARLGQVLNATANADALRQSINNRLAEVRQAVAGKPRPKVLIITSRNSHELNTLFTVGPTSFVSELVDVAGGDNLFADATQKYYEASKESIVLRAPDVVLEFHAGEPLSPEEEQHFVDDWKQMPSLPAVRDGRIYVITESYALRPGPRITLLAELLAQLLHPDAGISAPQGS